MPTPSPTPATHTLVTIGTEAVASQFLVQPCVEIILASPTLRRLAIAVENQNNRSGSRCPWCLERTGCDCLNLKFGSLPK